MNVILAQLIVGTSHCADLQAPSPYDLPSMTADRLQISAFVNTTLSPTANEQSSSSSSSKDTCDDQSAAVAGLSVAFGITLVALIYVLSFGAPSGLGAKASEPLISDDNRMRA